MNLSRQMYGCTNSMLKQIQQPRRMSLPILRCNSRLLSRRGVMSRYRSVELKTNFLAARSGPFSAGKTWSGMEPKPVRGMDEHLVDEWVDHVWGHFCCMNQRGRTHATTSCMVQIVVNPQASTLRGRKQGLAQAARALTKAG